ncbi:GNAT family N-acetyltransferase [Enterococcus termitis]|nr:GNAT family N-acetyltransferase [Enterococcus termitis]OJG99174.1 hypothetical protein RV18_GL002328 [Enterococcus termitis]
MLKKMKTINHEMIELLALATAKNKVEKELNDYVQSSNRCLYLEWQDDTIIGCIGINTAIKEEILITHLAVGVAYQRHGVGSAMIDFIKKKYKPATISAETDRDSVCFYQKYGFQVYSLGEKYPNVERFRCVFNTKKDC